MADFSSNFSTDASGTTSFGDLLMLGGDLVLTQDIDPRGTHPVLQDVLQRLRTFLGEWFLDNTIGVPWFQQILGPQGPNSATDATLQNVVLGTPGVLMLTEWSASVNSATRTLSLHFVATTAAGKISYTGSPVASVDGTAL